MLTRGTGGGGPLWGTSGTECYLSLQRYLMGTEVLPLKPHHKGTSPQHSATSRRWAVCRKQCLSGLPLAEDLTQFRHLCDIPFYRHSGSVLLVCGVRNVKDLPYHDQQSSLWAQTHGDFPWPTWETVFELGSKKKFVWPKFKPLVMTNLMFPVG